MQQENSSMGLETINVDAQEDWVPRIGMKFSTVDQAYEFYIAYGAKMGFSVRIGYTHKKKEDDETITSRVFYCNKEGFRKDDKRATNSRRRRAERRTNCRAMMGVKRRKDATYVCTKFIPYHNHLLHTTATSHFLQSQRRISDVAAHEIDLADGSGISQKSTFELLAKQAGGKECLGFIALDLKNYLRTKRQKQLAFGDAGRMQEYFENKCRKNPSYFVSYQFDSDEQITNIFWADARMIIDYSLFGDVITFDTTYCTNKESRPFGVFCGFNHHRNVVVFGAALLYDETADLFKWLFETFLKAHKGKIPVTMFTDQDAAMAKAISEVLPNTWHGLCTWHIMQNALKHIGFSLLTDLKACMYEYDDKELFEVRWKRLVEKCASKKRNWLDMIYKLKEKWANCFMKNTFTLGMHSTQLSESFNSDLKDYLKSSLNIIRFLEQFERVVTEKRDKELKAEFDARDKLPLNDFPKVHIMNQAAEIYTPNILDLFQREYRSVGACSAEAINENIGDLRGFVVEMDGIEYEVTVVDEHTGLVINCTCKKFETWGFLCCHILRVLDVLKIKYIPEGYIIKRWTKSARDIEVFDREGVIVEEDPNLSSTKRYQHLCSELVSLALKASETEEGFGVAKKHINCLRAELSELCKGVDLVDRAGVRPHMSTYVLKKKEATRKGGRRLKPWIETMKRKKKNDFTNRNSKDTAFEIGETNAELSFPPLMMRDSHLIVSPQASNIPWICPIATGKSKSPWMILILGRKELDLF